MSSIPGSGRPSAKVIQHFQRRSPGTGEAGAKRPDRMQRGADEPVRTQALVATHMHSLKAAMMGESSWPRQVFQDRAIRALVAVAVVRQVLQRRDHGLHLRDLALQVVHVAGRNLFHCGTASRFVLPQR